MELQFHKTQCPCLQQVKREVQSQEQTQEVRLPDSMPDIGSVLGAWGQVLMRSKEWRSGSMQVSGGVMAWVLYMPEEGGHPQCVEVWIPFQLRWDLPDTDVDGKIGALCLLRSVDARSTSARKLMVRATVSALAEAHVPGQADIYDPDTMPEDIQVLKNNYPIQLPVEAGEKIFTIEEEMTLPGTCPPMEKLIRYCLQPELTEKRVMADKVVFRGTAILHILYRAEDGNLCCWDFDLPFSQYAELDREYDQDATARILLAVTSLELDVDEQSRMRVKAGMTGQYVISDRTMVELVEDAYSPRRSVKPQLETLQLPVTLEEYVQTIHAEQTVLVDGSKVVDVAFYPDHARLQQGEGATQVGLPGVFQMLYYDDNGGLQSATARWEGQWALPMDAGAQVETLVSACGKPQGSMSAGEGTVRAELMMECRTAARRGMPMVTALEMGEVMDPEPDRPSVILRRAGDESLWEMAKTCGSTVEAIEKANGLKEEPTDRPILLIPVL